METLNESVRFQVTTFGTPSQFSRVADRSIHAGIRADDLPEILGVDAESVDLRVALELTVSEGRKYSFKNERGEFCQLEAATR